MTKTKSLRQGKILFRKKSAVLVEFSETSILERYSFPAESIKVEEDGSTVLVSDEDIDQMGIAYGVPWEYLLEGIIVSPNQLADSLHKNGIWTAEDAMSNPDGIKGALLSSLSHSISSIIRVAKESKSKEM